MKEGRDLFALIDRWADTGLDDTAEVERRIRDEFEETCAILVIDTKGFSRSVHRDGVLAFLARTWRRSLTVWMVRSFQPVEDVTAVADPIEDFSPEPETVLTEEITFDVEVADDFDLDAG